MVGMVSKLGHVPQSSGTFLDICRTPRLSQERLELGWEETCHICFFLVKGRGKTLLVKGEDEMVTLQPENVTVT